MQLRDVVCPTSPVTCLGEDIDAYMDGHFGMSAAGFSEIKGINFYR